MLNVNGFRASMSRTHILPAALELHSASHEFTHERAEADAEVLKSLRCSEDGTRGFQEF